MDELERIIRENKASFDDGTPDKMKMWTAIERRLNEQSVHAPNTKRVFLSRRFLGIAASLLLLALIGSVFFIQSNQNSTTMVAHQEELHDINSYYNQLINYKVQQVKTSQALSDSDKNEFLEYFKELEDACQALEQDLAFQFDNEQVIGAIVENYRQRLNLLENLLRRLNQTKEKSDEQSILL